MGIQEDIKPRMRWWGWGVDGFDKPIKPAAVKILTDVCGMDIDANTPPPNVEDVKINPSALDADDIAALKEAVGDEFFKDDHYTRVMHTYGRSYPDLLRLRLGVLEIAPDAIVYPGNEDQVAKVIKVCEEREIAIIPFGGGTSVAGGVEAVRGGFKKAISLSTLRFNKIKEINKDAMTFTVEPGVFGRTSKRNSANGVTVGHFPQSSILHRWWLGLLPLLGTGILRLWTYRQERHRPPRSHPEGCSGPARHAVLRSWPGSARILPRL